MTPVWLSSWRRSERVFGQESGKPSAGAVGRAAPSAPQCAAYKPPALGCTLGLAGAAAPRPSGASWQCVREETG